MLIRNRIVLAFAGLLLIDDYTIYNVMVFYRHFKHRLKYDVLRVVDHSTSPPSMLSS